MGNFYPEQSEAEQKLASELREEIREIDNLHKEAEILKREGKIKASVSAFNRCAIKYARVKDKLPNDPKYSLLNEMIN